MPGWLLHTLNRFLTLYKYPEDLLIGESISPSTGIDSVDIQMCVRILYENPQKEPYFKNCPICRSLTPLKTDLTFSGKYL